MPLAHANKIASHHKLRPISNPILAPISLPLSSALAMDYQPLDPSYWAIPTHVHVFMATTPPLKEDKGKGKAPATYNEIGEDIESEEKDDSGLAVPLRIRRTLYAGHTPIPTPEELPERVRQDVEEVAAEGTEHNTGVLRTAEEANIVDGQELQHKREPDAESSKDDRGHTDTPSPMRMERIVRRAEVKERNRRLLDPDAEPLTKFRVARSDSTPSLFTEDLSRRLSDIESGRELVVPHVLSGKKYVYESSESGASQLEGLASTSRPATGEVLATKKPDALPDQRVEENARPSHDELQANLKHSQTQPTTRQSSSSESQAGSQMSRPTAASRSRFKSSILNEVLGEMSDDEIPIRRNFLNFGLPFGQAPPPNNIKQKPNEPESQPAQYNREALPEPSQSESQASGSASAKTRRRFKSPILDKVLGEISDDEIPIRRDLLNFGLPFGQGPSRNVKPLLEEPETKPEESDASKNQNNEETESKSKDENDNLESPSQK